MKTNMGARMPAAWTNAVTAGAKSKAGTSAPAKVTARIDMSAEVAGAGLCPECRKPMTKAFANGHPVHVCHEHLIAIPIADEGVNPEDVVPEAQATAEKLEADDAGQPFITPPSFNHAHTNMNTNTYLDVTTNMQPKLASVNATAKAEPAKPVKVLSKLETKFEIRELY